MLQKHGNLSLGTGAGPVYFFNKITLLNDTNGCMIKMLLLITCIQKLETEKQNAKHDKIGLQGPISV